MPDELRPKYPPLDGEYLGLNRGRYAASLSNDDCGLWLLEFYLPVFHHAFSISQKTEWVFVPVFVRPLVGRTPHQNGKVLAAQVKSRVSATGSPCRRYTSALGVLLLGGSEPIQPDVVRSDCSIFIFCLPQITENCYLDALTSLK